MAAGDDPWPWERPVSTEGGAWTKGARPAWLLRLETDLPRKVNLAARGRSHPVRFGVFLLAFSCWFARIPATATG
jgi:hypothetical protein